MRSNVNLRPIVFGIILVATIGCKSVNLQGCYIQTKDWYGEPSDTFYFDGNNVSHHISVGLSQGWYKGEIINKNSFRMDYSLPGYSPPGYEPPLDTSEFVRLGRNKFRIKKRGKYKKCNE